MTRTILYIVEGEVDEKRLMERLWKKFDSENNYTIHSFKSSITSLLSLLFIDGKLDPNLDIVKLLKSNEIPEKQRLCCEDKFTDVYLVFDLDPQGKIDIEKIKILLDFFNDSSDRGKLFINYPMLESYVHIVSKNDNGFKDRVVHADQIKNYKRIVDKEACPLLKQTNNIDSELFKSIITMHLKKENYLLRGCYELPFESEFFAMSGRALFDFQMKTFEERKLLYVINTSIFCVVDYMPSKFLPKSTEK